MTEPRTITVGPVNPTWQEYDREVLIELWHNATQSNAFHLSREEARRLCKALEQITA